MAGVGEICEVEFKPKSNGQKVIRAAAEATGKPDPTARPPAAVPSLDSLIARALTAALSPQSSLASAELSRRIQVGSEVVYVRGYLDSYEVHISNGAIYRVSDGKRVHISTAISRLGLGAIGLPDFAGITELFSQILILAEDAKNATALTTSAE